MSKTYKDLSEKFSLSPSPYSFVPYRRHIGLQTENSSSDNGTNNTEDASPEVKRILTQFMETASFEQYQSPSVSSFQTENSSIDDETNNTEDANPGAKITLSKVMGCITVIFGLFATAWELRPSQPNSSISDTALNTNSTSLINGNSLQLNSSYSSYSTIFDFNRRTTPTPSCDPQTRLCFPGKLREEDITSENKAKIYKMEEENINSDDANKINTMWRGMK